MEAKETNFLRFINSPKQLVIPIYQRTYNWKQKECEQLWRDIIKAGSDSNISGHFIGSIVYVEKGLYQVSALPKLLVIDGQQRLTTISLLISAICNSIKNKKIETDINPEKIASYYLINDKEESEDKYKLVLTKSDKETLFKVIDGRELSDDDSNTIKENYNYFMEQISKSDLKILYNGISKLIIIDVSLDREKDNPQLIFESLNSTGLELTQADLIRNYILMGLEKPLQEEIYNNYWYLMERSFSNLENSELFDNFMRDYLTVKLNRIPTTREIYSEFKQYSSKFGDVRELVRDIYEFSKYFVNIALESEPDEDVRRVLKDINELKVDVSYPFILAIYQDYAKEKINKQDLIEILKLIESYVFRRAICGVPTNSMNKTFSTLYKDIDQKNYLESIKALFVIQDSYRRFPKDEEFGGELAIKDVYNFRIRNYLLRKIENHDRKEFVDVETYTIEHIMPQNPILPLPWKTDLGENWKEIQKEYLHTIGNLTLTGYNSELSDSPFKEKRDMKGGFRDSPIRLNRYLANLEVWNGDEIKKRAADIVKLSVEIWNYPYVDTETINKYIVAVEKLAKTSYSLEDHPYLRQGEPMKPLFEDLRKRILNIDSSVREEPQKLYIAYKSFTNFVDIVPQKKALRLSLNMQFEKIKDPEGKCKDVHGKGRWGNGDVEVRLSSYEDLDYIMGLIKQSFDNILEENSN